MIPLEPASARASIIAFDALRANKLRLGAHDPRRRHRRDHGDDDGLDRPGHPDPDLQRDRAAAPDHLLRDAVLLPDAAQPRQPALRGPDPARARARPTPRRSRRSPRSVLPASGSRSFARIEYQGERTQTIDVWGADDHYMDIQGGTLLRGRFFTRAELNRRAGRSCWRPRWPTGSSGGSTRSASYVRVGGTPVPGHRHLPEAGEHLRAARPGRTARSSRTGSREVRPAVRRDQRALHCGAGPRPSVDVTRAQDLVTVALRRERQPPPRRAQHLRPDDPGPDPRHHEQAHLGVLRR